MTRKTIFRGLITVLILGLLAASLLLSNWVNRCSAEGGFVDWKSWQCRPIPRIHIERDIQRS